MADTEQVLRDLLARVDELEQYNHVLEQRHVAIERECTMLKQQTVTLLARTDHQRRPSHTAGEARVSTLERLSRRWFLRRAAQTAAATAIAGMLIHRDTREAAAEFTIFDEISCNLLNAGLGSDVAIDASTTSDDRAATETVNYGSGPGVRSLNHGLGPSIEGIAINVEGTGIRGTGRYGVWGETTQEGFDGVVGRNTSSSGNGVRGTGATGVMGSSINGIGVWGNGSGTSHAGVLGRNSSGDGVRGEGRAGVFGISSTDGYEGVYGQHTGANGYGVVGDGTGVNGAGVLGRNAASDGVIGEGVTGVRGRATNGVGVYGEGGSGYGGVFKGTRAQVRLAPTGRTGKPTSGVHQIGELYLDKVGSLFICTAAGTPGTWKKVTAR